MHILYELLPKALLHFTAWEHSRRRHIVLSRHPLVLSDCAPTTLQKTKRMQASPSALLDQDGGHQSARHEEDGETKLLTHSPSQTSRLELEQ